MAVRKLGKDFSGAKIALICDRRILTYLRDDNPLIPFPNLWDLAGGGREGDETPEQCVCRETKEEFGLDINASRIIWKRRYENASAPKEHAYFLAANITRDEIAAIDFGDEGQYWWMMETAEFLKHPEAVPQLKVRLAHYISQSN
jgi:8-oxo-dGTP diphosphatase